MNTTFYFSITKKDNRKGGWKYTAKVYKIEKKVPIFLAEGDFYSTAMMGITSEVLHILVRAGKVPVKYKNKYALDTPFKIYEI